MADDERNPPAHDLTSEIAALRREIAHLNAHRFIRIHNSLGRLLVFQFLRGLALGLGTVLGASALVSLLGYFLAQIDFIPIIGDWAVQLAEQIQTEVEANRAPRAGPGTTASPDGSIETPGD